MTNKSKITKVFLIIFGSLILIAAGLMYLNTQRNSYKLTLNITPKEAVIKVNGVEVGKGSVTKNFPKGRLKFTIEADNYITDEREIDFITDKTYNINLIKKLGLSSAPDKFRFKSTQSVGVYSPNIVNDTDIYGYDKVLKNVFAANENTYTKIYSGDLEFYSFADPYIIFGDKKVTDKIFIYSLKDNITTTLPVKEIAPVIFATFNPTYNVLLVLGKYNHLTRTSTLLATKIEGGSFQTLTTTTANSVESLKDNQVILFEKLDGNDASYINILDLASLSIKYSSNGNKYLVSPTKQSLAIVSSNKIAIVNLINYSKRDIAYSKTEKVIWNDEVSFIVIHNQRPGVTYSYLETEYGKETKEEPISELNGKTIKEIIGKSEKYLYLRDTEGAIWKISLN